MNLVCPRTPDGPEGVLAALREVSGALREEGDARAIFPDVYAVITEGVVAGMSTGLFAEPEFMSRLAGRFAARYLETLSWSLSGLPQDCAAWSIAYAQVGRPGVAAIQHAGLGISAHINFDLALGVAEVIGELAPERDPALMGVFKRDYDAVNPILETAMPRVMRLLAERYGCPLSPLFTGPLGGLTGGQALAVVAQWREQVWRNALGLLEADGEAGRRAVVDRMELDSRVIALLVAGPPLVGPAVALARRVPRLLAA
ncbi:DUF5995 family protein [Planobispora longispora]|uniref:DUF5995 family protein n=1 Tax=Planobispora longispora TaxID=28887 RepID=UPI00194385EA|nr:DUF5995 family protein [Planobispora longispora]